MSDAIADAKRALRAELRERRHLLSPAQREAAASGIADQLHALIAARGARSISCYLAAPWEPGTREFVHDAVANGIRVLLPVTRSDGLLDWSVAAADQEIIEGLVGSPEPLAELLGPIAVNDVDLMIVPAAAVDASGMRLGWGRGFFDKTLGSMERRPPVYAIVFDTEVIDEVPRDVHDQAVSGAVTPTRTVEFAPTRR